MQVDSSNATVSNSLYKAMTALSSILKIFVTNALKDNIVVTLDLTCIHSEGMVTVPV